LRIEERELRQIIYYAIAMILVSKSAAWGEEIRIPYAPTNPKFTLPPSNGPHSVGVRSFAWMDETRVETAGPNEADFREITVQVWYPATVENTAKSALYTPELKEMLLASANLSAGEQKFVKAHEVFGNTATNSVPGAKILEAVHPWPVILFSPGGNVSRHWQTALAERISSQGVVFVSMSHPYSTMDVAPVSGFSMSIDWGLDQDDDQAATEADNRLAQVLAGDAAFVLHQLRKLVQDDDRFFSALELRHIGIAGHSRGGTTVGRACASNPDIVACAVIDNIGPDRERETGVKPPFLTLRAPWAEERIAVLHDYLNRTGSVAYDVELASSNHFTCTDHPLFMLDLRVAGIEPVDGIDACANILASFFDAYLRRRISTDDNTWEQTIRSDKVRITRF
jgi:pimeloyl-ACP methyl ester carboxylesterase